MITAHGISKKYCDQVLFEDATFSVNRRERIGLVGRNGHGKSTLFRLILGEEELDTGRFEKPRDYRIGSLSQHIVLSQPTVIEETCLGLPDDQKDDVWKAEKLLDGLGFSEADYERSPAEFSSGYQMRIHLAKVLLSEPHLLLLDEPTNYLDIVSIRWFENFLRSWPDEVIIISHDRAFMDRVTTHVMGIHRGRVRKYAGKTANYYELVQKDEENYEKGRLGEEKKRKEMQEFIDKFKARASHATLVQSRVRALEKMGQREKLAGIDSLSFSFTVDEFPAQQLLDARSISFSYSGKEPYLIQDFDLPIGKNDRICIIGKNGRGKTTLLKMLSGVLMPTKGEVKFHPAMKKAYFEYSQTRELDPNKTIEDELIATAAGVTRQMARNVCGSMMFSGDDALKKVNVLSGGEKSRVLLGKLLLTPSNILLLDEPTHHLDIPSCEALIDAVKSFNGAAIIVTHDEEFLYDVATKLVVFHHNRLFVYPGTYAEFLDQIGWDDEAGEAEGEKPSHL
jgi:ATP-binding cassette subfamily F protein 3